MTVAQAAPATPIPKLTMKTMSSTTLQTEAMMRKNSGVRLSPRARMTLERRLKKREAKMPAKITDR